MRTPRCRCVPGISCMSRWPRPKRRLGVESRFDLDDRHDQPGFDPMLRGIPFREPRTPSGPTARISRSALKRPKN
ncbi:MAG: hypothetical protein ACLSHC_02725 [Bilophila wadsworthia]